MPTSYLFISQDTSKQETFVTDLAQKEHIQTFDIIRLPIEEGLGIEEIRNIQKQLFLKPLKSSQKIIVINHADSATIAAQNALLKVLEEPPAHTIVVLLATDLQNFLPTILSRCTVIQSDQIQQEEIRESTKEEWQKITQADVATKLACAQSVASDKDETILWLKQVILLLRQDLLLAVNKKEKEEELFFQIVQVQKAYTLAKTTNVNIRMTLENLFLQM